MQSNQIILTQTEFNKLKNEVKLNSDKEIIYSSDDDELNRKVIEKLPVNFLLVNQSGRKDFQKQRNSGFNQVMAKVMKKKNIILGINFDEILECKGLREKAEIFARIKQNIFLCNKNKVKMKFVIRDEKNSRNIYDLKALGLVLGMPTWMTKGL
jgi:RNase P/RNase MRP subunit p30